NLFGPFPNASSFELGEWFYGQGTQKSLKDFKSLIRILTSPGFSIGDIKDTKWTRVFQDLGKNKEDFTKPEQSDWIDDAGWKKTEVKIDVPVHHRMLAGRGMESHVVGTLHHRGIVSILEEKVRNAADLSFLHLDGHELRWKPDKSKDSEFRVISELYNSNVFLKAESEIRDNPPPQIQGCSLQRVVVGIQFWSDATHLSAFSTSKIWPLYMIIGNESKHRRGKGIGESYHHVAYFDSISDDFKDYLIGRTGGRIPDGLMAHLNRECFHAQWVILLDDELLKAISEGVVIECSDGVKRRFFIRILTYSTDYPERKVFLHSTIKTQGDCPCASCLTERGNFDQMGTLDDTSFRKANPRVDSITRQAMVDKARTIIKGGKAVSGKPVKRVLSHSNAPVENAFSKRLSSTGFNVFSTLVVDVLHEYEIGVWKALFLHLIRVLEASGTGSLLVLSLNQRYRSVPTFNQTIRKFSSNVSQLNRRAARDYEDILQCAIPAFNGLFPDSSFDGIVTRLLYINARWHGFAKLRMHTDATLILFERITTQLGDAFREFIHVVDTIDTVELQKEADQRARAAVKKRAKAQATANGSRSGNARRPKKLNISTVKFHALGHYPSNIRSFGPTDIYSTEWGESFHRSPKAWFKCTSKKLIRKEISMHERRRVRLKRAKYRLLKNAKSPKAQEIREQSKASRDPNIHHYIGPSKNSPVYISQFLPNGNLANDAASSGFLRHLKAHLLPRILRAMDPKIDDKTLQEDLRYLDSSNIVFKDDRIYTHRIMRIKYTTYDTRRDEDIIHLDTDQSNVMILNPTYSRGSPSHPFSYGKVIGILHANMGYVGSIGRQGAEYDFYPLEFVWIRRYEVHPASGDFELDQAEILPIDTPASHCFVDPSDILRACHMVPNFDKGPRYYDGKGRSAIANDGSDWERYFINRFVDRNMLMRYEWGLAVGHTYAYKDAAIANSDILCGQGLLSDDLAVPLGPRPPTSPDDPVAPANSDGGPKDGKDDGLAEELGGGVAEGDARDEEGEDEDEGEEDGEGDDDEGEEDGEGDDDEGDSEGDELDSDDEERSARDLEYDSEAEKELALFGCEDD
ncbi:hypothetical protein FA13DRAFT_1640158, partial [Coprinellus micaceus]